eukprot:670740-Prymnesium_polylepis.1
MREGLQGDALPADTSRVGGDVDAAVRRVQLDRDKLAQVAGAPQLAERVEQPVGLAVEAEDEAVEEDEVAAARVQVVSAEQVDVLDAQRETEPPDRLLPRAVGRGGRVGGTWHGLGHVAGPGSRGGLGVTWRAQGHVAVSGHVAGSGSGCGVTWVEGQGHVAVRGVAWRGAGTRASSSSVV